MTDKEIVLALKIHNDKKLSDCSNCPLVKYDDCLERLIDNAIDCIEFYATDRPKGEWLHDDMYIDVKCSICNSYALDRGDYPELSKYCPACGALMKNPEVENG